MAFRDLAYIGEYLAWNIGGKTAVAIAHFTIC
jgi:hypothetical protein